MPKDLFYLPTYKNVGTLFEKIATAKAPDAFTQRYLAGTLGLKSTGDRALINMLKKLGFIDQGGRPTNEYNLLKNRETASQALAKGLRGAYEPLFTANEKANDLNTEQLKGLISQVSGADHKTSALIAYTFNAIAKNADFSQTDGAPAEIDEEDDQTRAKPPTDERRRDVSEKTTLRPDFHFNIQIHLPANGTEETYLNIFAALRRTFS
jgi:hypothetical protein